MKEHPYVHCSVIHNSQALEAAQVPISKGVDQKAMVHWDNGMLFGHKNEGNITFCNNIMDGPAECYSKWNKPARERQGPYDFTYMWNLMN